MNWTESIAYDPAAEQCARRYERTQSLLFVLRMGLLFLLALICWLSGIPRLLSTALGAAFTFSHSWVLSTVIYTAFMVLAFEVVLFPLAVFSDYELEKMHGLERSEFGPWLRGYFMTLILELSIVTAGFTGIYALMHLTPAYWWFLASLAYALIVLGLTDGGPAWLLPRLNETTEIWNEDVKQSVKNMAERLKIPVPDCRRWQMDEVLKGEDVMLVQNPETGGRQLVFTASALRDFSSDELKFLAARELERYRWKGYLKFFILRFVLTSAVFGLTAIGMNWFTKRAALPHVSDLAGFPFLVVLLFSFSTLMAPALNHFSRKMELHSDRFAIQEFGTAPMLSLFGKIFARQPFGFTASWWEVLLLRDIPTVQRRMKTAVRTNAR